VKPNGHACCSDDLYLASVSRDICQLVELPRMSIGGPSYLWEQDIRRATGLFGQGHKINLVPAP